MIFHSEQKSIQEFKMYGPTLVLTPQQVNSEYMVLSEDQNLILISTKYDGVQLWSRSRGKCIYKRKLQESTIGICMSSDMGFIAFQSRNKGNGLKNIMIARLSNLKNEFSLKGHNQQVNKMMVTKDCNTIISAAEDNTIRLWNVQSRKQIRKMPTPGGINFDFSVDQTQIVGFNNRIIYQWETSSGKLIKQWEGSQNSIVCVSCSDKYIATCAKETSIFIWKYDGTKHKELVGHKKWCISVHISTDSELLISSSHDQTIRVWNIAKQTTILLLVNQQGLIGNVILSKGKTLIIAVGTHINIWNKLTLTSKKPILM